MEYQLSLSKSFLIISSWFRIYLSHLIHNISAEESIYPNITDTALLIERTLFHMVQYGKSNYLFRGVADTKIVRRTLWFILWMHKYHYKRILYG